MKKLGPLTIELVVASAIYHLKKTKKEARTQELIGLLNGKIMMSELPEILTSLMDWGIVKTEYTGIETGRAGNKYYISGEANSMIREVYKLYWRKVYNGSV